MFVRFAQLLFFIAVIHRLTQSDSVILSQSDIYNDKKLLYYSLKAFENGTEEDIILFKGQRTPEAFDLNNKNAHAVFNVSIAFTSWKQMTAMINATAFAAPGNKAVHVHNQNMPFSHFLMNLIRDTGLPRPFPSEPMDIPLQTWLQTMDQGQPPIVITNQVDENYGWLSTFIRNRTVNWGNLTKDLNDQCSDYNSVRRFLNSSKILLIVTSSHVDPQIGFHEKIISLPLGVNVKEVAFSKAKLILTLPYRKKKLLLINNSGWGGRRHINAVVSKAFNNTIHNTYKKHNNRVVRMGRNLTVPLDHYLEIATSKFVLCPSGLGYDTFRWDIKNRLTSQNLSWSCVLFFVYK